MFLCLRFRVVRSSADGDRHLVAFGVASDNASLVVLIQPAERATVLTTAELEELKEYKSVPAWWEQSNRNPMLVYSSAFQDVPL